MLYITPIEQTVQNEYDDPVTTLTPQYNIYTMTIFYQNIEKICYNILESLNKIVSYVCQISLIFCAN